MNTARSDAMTYACARSQINCTLKLKARATHTARCARPNRVDPGRSPRSAGTSAVCWSVLYPYHIPSRLAWEPSVSVLPAIFNCRLNTGRVSSIKPRSKSRKRTQLLNNVCRFHHSLGSGPWCYPFARLLCWRCALSRLHAGNYIGQNTGMHVARIKTSQRRASKTYPCGIPAFAHQALNRCRLVCGMQCAETSSH